jgi:hypothetical protein
MRVLREALEAERLAFWRSNISLRPLRIVWTGRNATTQIPPKAAREKEATKKMARRRLTLKDQLKGVRAAISSKRTPPQLREGLKRRAQWLAKRLKKPTGVSIER